MIFFRYLTFDNVVVVVAKVADVFPLHSLLSTVFYEDTQGYCLDHWITLYAASLWLWFLSRYLLIDVNDKDNRVDFLELYNTILLVGRLKLKVENSICLFNQRSRELGSLSFIIKVEVHFTKLTGKKRFHNFFSVQSKFCFIDHVCVCKVFITSIEL
jgi:hypothetical protein